MKRIILILALVGLAFTLKAQDREVDMTPLGLNQSLKDYQGVAADTAGVSQSNVVFDLRVKSHRPMLHNIEVDISATNNGSGTFDLLLQGKIFSSDNWSTIDGTNTTLSGNQTIDFTTDLTEVVDTFATTNHPFYRFFRVKINGSSLQPDDTYTLNYIYFKFYRR